MSELSSSTWGELCTLKDRPFTNLTLKLTGDVPPQGYCLLENLTSNSKSWHFQNHILNSCIYCICQALQYGPNRQTTGQIIYRSKWQMLQIIWLIMPNKLESPHKLPYLIYYWHILPTFNTPITKQKQQM